MSARVEIVNFAANRRRNFRGLGAKEKCTSRLVNATIPYLEATTDLPLRERGATLYLKRDLRPAASLQPDNFTAIKLVPRDACFRVIFKPEGLR